MSLRCQSCGDAFWRNWLFSDQQCGLLCVARVRGLFDLELDVIVCLDINFWSCNGVIRALSSLNLVCMWTKLQLHNLQMTYDMSVPSVAKFSIWWQFKAMIEVDESDLKLGELVTVVLQCCCWALACSGLLMFSVHRHLEAKIWLEQWWWMWSWSLGRHETR